MIRYNSVLSQIELSIPHKDFGDVSRYRKGLLRVLAEIRIDDCRPDFKDDLKAVYELLECLAAEEEEMESTTRLNGI